MDEATKLKLSESLKGNQNAKNKPKPKGFGKKISRILSGKKRTPEQCERISQGKLGHKVSEDTKKKISRANKGRKRTAEQRARMAEAQRERYRKQAEREAQNESEDGV